MRALRHLASAALILAAALLAAMGIMLVAAALGDDPPEAGPALVAAIGGLFLAIASVLGWGAWVAQLSGSRAQLLLLTVVAAFFALLPINALIGPVGIALNVLCGIVAGVALLAFLTRGRRTEKGVRIYGGGRT
jgi:hypothetical protein